MVHLTQAARDVLETIPRFATKDANGKDAVSDLVFTINGRTSVSGYSGAKRSLDEEVAKARKKAAEDLGQEPEPMAAWRLHDMRRTGVSKLAALGFNSIVADKLLAHKPAKLRGVASVYQRHEFGPERKRALEAWADHVCGMKPSGNVVRLLRGRDAGSVAVSGERHQ